jgi:hypothetical protein
MIGVTCKMAWFMMHRIREAMKDDGSPLGGPGKVVESDEAFLGAKRKRRLSGKIRPLKKVRERSSRTGIDLFPFRRELRGLGRCLEHSSKNLILLRLIGFGDRARELIKWIRRQAAVDNAPSAVASPPRDEAGERS